MKLLVLAVLLGSIYCSENEDLGSDYKERRIAGGGSYGGFIGLTTYGAEPFLVKGKYQRDNQDYLNDKEETNFKNVNENGDPNYRTLSDEKKDNDEYLAYLGYRAYGNCKRGNRNRSASNVSDYDVNNKCDRLYGYTGPTANDEPENLVRPCALDDWQCIRKYFASNSNCKPAYGPIPDPLYADVNTVFFSVINVTVSLTNMMVTGLSSAKITEFYVNKKSGNLVLAFDVTNLNETSERAYFRYRRTAKESIVLADYATVNFRTVTFTVMIPNIPHLRLDLADIHADIQDSTPEFFVGPEASSSADPDVVTAYPQLTTFLPFAVREGLLFQSQLFMSAYIQRNICDFGLKIISV